MDENTFTDYCDNIRKSIEHVVKENPKTTIVVMPESKTQEQIDFIVSCAKEHGLKVVVDNPDFNYQEFCKELNSHLPCKSQDDVDALTRLIKENIDPYPNRNIYWSRELYINANCNDDKCMNILLHNDNVLFTPTEDPEEHRGVTARYKYEVEQDLRELAVYAIIDRTTGQTARAFTPDQRETILPALKELGADKLFAEAEKQPEMKSAYSGWKDDVLQELKDLEKGIIREEGQALKR